MFKSAVVLCLACFVVIEARPKWQFLPSVPGYVPVYIQAGDTPLDQINPELAEAFHVLPAGRSVSKQIDASDEQPEPVLVEPAEPVAEDEEPASKVEEPAIKVEEPSVKVEEPSVKVVEPSVKVVELAVKVVEPSVKVVEPSVKVEEPSVKVEQPEEDSAVVETTELKETPEDVVDRRPYAKKVLEKKKKVNIEVAQPERR